MTRQNIITRRLNIVVEFHQVDMMQVVHNSHYFRWFEKGRLQLFGEVVPISWAVEKKIAALVIMNHAEYLHPATYDDALVVTTQHRVKDRWDGRFLFNHSVSNAKTKIELCFGETAVTIVDLDSGQLVKEIPEDIWNCYLALK